MNARSILVVDDDAFLREVVTEMLQRMGDYTVLTAADGNEALVAVRASHEPVDAVVCDLDMEGMDGLQLLRHLAEEDFGGRVVLMSGARDDVLATAKDLALLHGLRLTGLLRKPLDPDSLRRSLEGEPVLEPVLGGERESPDGPHHLTAEDMRRGIDGGRVAIHVQPKVTVMDRRVVGAEALLRWRADDGHYLPPTGVMADAEAFGLVDELTMAVFRCAVEALRAWQEEGVDTRISVNLSHSNLASLALPDAMSDIVQAAGIDPGQITLEVSQGELVEDLTVGMEVAGRLRLKGFGISVDDYGIGYSILSQLKNLPLTEIKVDRSFVEGAEDDQTLREILGSSASLGHLLGLSVVAQGVETQQVLELLESLGCDEMQGYLVARPMPGEEFPAWTRRWKAAWRAGEGAPNGR